MQGFSFVFRNEINEFYRLIYIIEDKWMEHTVATDPKEIRYIKKRKRKAFREKLCFYVCRIFPVKNKLISICTFEGKGGFGCNAKPLVKRLHEMNFFSRILKTRLQYLPVDSMQTSVQLYLGSQSHSSCRLLVKEEKRAFLYSVHLSESVIPIQA